MDAASPFLTFVKLFDDSTFSTQHLEVLAMLHRNNVIEDFLSGRVDVDYLLDFLNENGVEPTEYLDCIEDNLDYLFGRIILLDNVEHFLPF